MKFSNWLQRWVSSVGHLTTISISLKFYTKWQHLIHNLFVASKYTNFQNNFLHNWNRSMYLHIHCIKAKILWCTIYTTRQIHVKKFTSNRVLEPCYYIEKMLIRFLCSWWVLIIQILPFSKSGRTWFLLPLKWKV